VTAIDIDAAASVFADPAAYADEARFHAACAWLRRHAPVPRVDVDGYPPFYAVTKYDDVLEISRQSDRWHNTMVPALGPHSRDGAPAVDAGVSVRTLVQMDAPDHPVYRHISSDWFKPKRIAELGDRVTALAQRAVDHMAELDGECDFVTDVALHYPLYVILSLLGLPEADFPRMLQLTQELFGASDPELQRNDGDYMATMADFFGYFQGLIEDRRRTPRDDLASAIANARIDGEPIGILEVVGYYVLIATAGHDTTSAAIAGGLHALLDRPDELQRLRDNPALVPTAVDEMIRWVSPVKHFLRTAQADEVVRDVTVRAGESVMLSYPSANRDEDAFDHADRFDVGRTPNRHLGFGFGAHYCLGTHLARLEGKALYRELVPRLRAVELAGDARYTETLLVGGPKHLPIRYDLA
jgi:cytochrome P450